MKHITDFLGKPVLSLFESKVEGYVKNVIFDKSFKKIKQIIIFEDNEFQDEKMLDVNKIYSYGENAIIIKNNDCLTLKKEEIIEISNHINCKVFSTLGEFVGIIADVIIDEKTNLIDSIVLTNNKVLSPTQFFTFGQDVFFIKDEKMPISIASIKKKNNINTQSLITPKILVKIQNDNEQVLNGNSSELEKPETPETPHQKKYIFNDLSLPKKLTTFNNDFLIGRKTTKTIYSSNNEIIVKKNVNITDKIIQQAIIFNKLRELTIYSA